MKIKNNVYVSFLVISFISMLLASIAFGDDSDDVVRHVYYGRECSLLGGKKNCDGWKIESNMPYQIFIGSNGAELRYKSAYSATKLEVTGAAVAGGIIGLFGGISFTLVCPNLFSIVPQSVLLTGGVALFDGMYSDATRISSGHSISIIDPSNVKREFIISRWEMDIGNYYIDHTNSTGAILLNQPTDGDITINGSSWNE